MKRPTVDFEMSKTQDGIERVYRFLSSGRVTSSNSVEGGERFFSTASLKLGYRGLENRQALINNLTDRGYSLCPKQ